MPQRTSMFVDALPRRRVSLHSDPIRPHLLTPVRSVATRFDGVLEFIGYQYVRRLCTSTTRADIEPGRSGRSLAPCQGAVNFKHETMGDSLNVLPIQGAACSAKRPTRTCGCQALMVGDSGTFPTAGYAGSRHEHEPGAARPTPAALPLSVELVRAVRRLARGGCDRGAQAHASIPTSFTG